MNNLYMLTYMRSKKYRHNQMYVIAPTLGLAMIYFSKNMDTSDDLIGGKKINSDAIPLLQGTSEQDNED